MSGRKVRGAREQIVDILSTPLSADRKSVASGSNQDTGENTGNVFSGSCPGQTLIFTLTHTALIVSTSGQERKQRRKSTHSNGGKDEVAGTRVKPLNKLTRQTSFGHM